MHLSKVIYCAFAILRNFILKGCVWLHIAVNVHNRYNSHVYVVRCTCFYEVIALSKAYNLFMKDLLTNSHYNTNCKCISIKWRDKNERVNTLYRWYWSLFFISGKKAHRAGEKNVATVMTVPSPLYILYTHTNANANEMRNGNVKIIWKLLCLHYYNGRAIHLER